jgi:DNA repair protein RadA/Sms
VKEYHKAGKLLSISERGRWSGRRDYEGYYKNLATTSTFVEAPIEINLTKLDNLNFSDDLFKPLKTGTRVDSFLSTDGGFMPGTNIMVTGAPGIGKTTVLLEMLYNVKRNDPSKKVLFISAEMNKLDMARYLKRFPHWGQLPILFLSDYVDQNPQKVIESVLKEGWDIVLTDSYTEVNDAVKSECNVSQSKAEKWFLDLMTAHNTGNNDLKKYTVFVTILQLTKGGNFVGSNKLKHMTTGMMHLDWDDETELMPIRHMEFSKNRCGAVGEKLYFEIGGLNNGVSYAS